MDKFIEKVKGYVSERVVNTYGVCEKLKDDKYFNEGVKKFRERESRWLGKMEDKKKLCVDGDLSGFFKKMDMDLYNEMNGLIDYLSRYYGVNDDKDVLWVLSEFGVDTSYWLTHKETL